MSLSESFAGEKKEPREYWEDTALTYENVKFRVNTEGCYAGQNYFVGCMHALKAAAAAARPALTVATDRQLEARGFGLGKVVRRFGPVNIVELLAEDPREKDAKSIAALVRLVIESQKLEAESFAELYRHTGFNQGVDFDSLLRFLAPGVLFRYGEAYGSAQMINAYLGAAYDPHTRIAPRQAMKDEFESQDDEYIGIGVTFALFTGKAVVSTVLEGSPALAAGLRSNDLLVEVNGQPIAGLSINEITKKLIGPEGTSVTIKVLHKGQPVTRTIVRAKILLPNVTFKTVSDAGRRFAYIRLKSFMEREACDKVRTALLSKEAQEAQGLILDLRENPGGRMEQAVCLGGLLVGQKPILKTKLDQDNHFIEQVSQEQAVTRLPMVVLINEGSASASEVVAGALQDYQRAWIVGTHSFGKATVQSSDPYNPEFNIEMNLILLRTTERFYQPSGRTNQLVGIEPDFEVEPFPGATEDDKFAVREGDAYANALPAVGKSWVQPRPQAVRALQDCAAKRGVAKRVFDARKDDAIAPDYRLLVAEDILACALDGQGN